MTLTDTHCHLTLNAFDEDLPEVLQRAWDAGLDRILIPGTDVESSKEAIRFCEKDPRLFAAVGVHPNDALTWTETTQDELEELCQHPKVVAVGEIGLDYYRQYSPQELQRNILQIQLKIAEKRSLPVIIHSRQSLEDVLSILENWQKQLNAHGSLIANRPGVLHSFEGETDKAERAVRASFMIGISGPVTYRSAAERQLMVSQFPLESLLVETDAPYLTPHPHRGNRNEPAYVLHVAQKIADLRHISAAEVAQATTANADRLFLWRAPA